MVKASKPKPKPKAKKANGNGNGRRPGVNSGARSRPMRQPIAQSSVTVIRQQPSQTKLKDGTVIITHRELLTEIQAQGTAFSVVFKTPVNAGSPTLARWLAQQAQSYETYSFSSLSIDYVPMVPTTYGGIVYLAMDPDPRDPPPLSAPVMMVTPGSITGPVHKGMRWSARSQDLHNRPRFFVRDVANGGIIGTQTLELRSFDVGNFFAATEGVFSPSAAFTGTVGQLWVSYSIKLMQPQVYNTPAVTQAKFQQYIPLTSGAYQVDTENMYYSPTFQTAGFQYGSSFMGDVPGLGSAVPLKSDFEGIVSVTEQITPLGANLICPQVLSGDALVTATAANLPNPVLSKLSAQAGYGANVFGPTGAVVHNNAWAAETWYYLKAKAGDVVNWYSDYALSAANSAAGYVNLSVEFLAANPEILAFLAKIMATVLQKSVTVRGDGALTAALPFGPTAVGRHRPHASHAVQFDETTGVFTLQPGCYAVTASFTGTVITGIVATPAPAFPLVLDLKSCINAAATEALFAAVYYVDVVTTWDLSLVATTVTGSYIRFAPGGADHQDLENDPLLIQVVSP